MQRELAMATSRHVCEPLSTDVLFRRQSFESGQHMYARARLTAECSKSRGFVLDIFALLPWSRHERCWMEGDTGLSSVSRLSKSRCVPSQRVPHTVAGFVYVDQETRTKSEQIAEIKVPQICISLSRNSDELPFLDHPFTSAHCEHSRW